MKVGFGYLFEFLMKSPKTPGLSNSINPNFIAETNSQKLRSESFSNLIHTEELLREDKSIL